MISVEWEWFRESATLARSSGRMDVKVRLRTVLSLACMMSKENQQKDIAVGYGFPISAEELLRSGLWPMDMSTGLQTNYLVVGIHDSDIRTSNCPRITISIECFCHRQCLGRLELGFVCQVKFWWKQAPSTSQSASSERALYRCHYGSQR